MAVRIEFVLTNLAAQGIAMNAENFGCLGLVAVGAVQNTLDEALLELADGFVEQNPPLDHLIDEPFQLVFHDGTLR